MPAITPTLIQRSEVPEYPYVAPSIPDFQSIGLQSIIDFNGLVINDRFRPDRYFVKKITGLGQPDIRDNRIDVPSDHFEIAYDAFYKGATITVEGEIQAGSLAQSTRMYRDLEAALGTLIESPMKLRWFDVHDEFSDSMTSRAFWKLLNGAQVSFAGDGTMQFTAPGIAYYSLRKYVDARISSQVVIGNPIVSGSRGVILPLQDNENYVQLAVNGASGVFTISLSYVVGGVEKEIEVPIAINKPVVGQSIWLVLQKVGDQFIGNAYEKDPINNPSKAIASISASLTGSIAEKFGYKVAGIAGVSASGSASLTSWAIQDFRIDSIWPGDVYLNVRSIAPMAPQLTRESTVTSRFITPFQFAVRASNSSKRCPVAISQSMGPDVQLLLGRIYNRIFSQTYTVPINELGEISKPKAEQQAICTNRGTWIAKPVITIVGGITDPVVTNLTTGQSLILNGTIAANDFLTIDCAKHKITNSAGVDQFGLFDPESFWTFLVKGDNKLILTGREEVGTPMCTIQWQHTWL